MNPLGPLRFTPILKRAVWGGRRLGTLLAKPLGPDSDYAESWELVDHGADQSVVRAGPHRGQTLGALVAAHSRQLLGDALSRSASEPPSFPLLIKYLDCHKPLSIQVHPDDERAARLTPPDRGKTEAWVILHAEPDSVLYAGLKRGFDRAAFEREVARGTTALCLEKITPQIGDCYLIPAGTVHALGAGLVVAEVQQSSDTTYRIFDWNRLGNDGQPRALHLSSGLAAIRYGQEPVVASTPLTLPTSADGMLGERLIDGDKFRIDRWKTTVPLRMGGDGRLHVLMVLSGSMTMQADPAECPVGTFETVLLPASCPPLEVTPLEPATLLDITPPE